MLNQNLGGVTAPLQDRIAALPPSAAVGLWTFNGTDSPRRSHRAVSEDLVASPARPLSPPRWTASRQTAAAGVVHDAAPGVRRRAGEIPPGQPIPVLVITTGSHTDRTLDGEGLQDYVKGAVDPNRPVAINVIDVGDDPDRPSWEPSSGSPAGPTKPCRRTRRR